MLTAYALELKQKGTIKAENFPVSREMHQAVYDRLKGARHSGEPGGV